MSVAAPVAGHAVPLFGIVQWTMQLDNVTTNPWEAVNITLSLTPPPSAQPLYVPVKGYHHNGTEWRVRAALTAVGGHTYALRVTWRNASSGDTVTLHSSTGVVSCDAGAPAQPISAGHRGFLRPRFSSPPYRTAYDDGTLFNGFGLGDCLNPEYTFPTYNETDGTQFNRSLAQYMDDYAGAGFNIFRWSDGNCAFSITEGLDGNPLGRHGWRDQGNAYNAGYCALVDDLFDSLRSHGFSTWAVVFDKANSRYPIFPNMNESTTRYHVAQREAIARHLDFVVARWGAQVDVWSLLNEQRADANWYAYATAYLRSIDPYRHPISTSWDDHVNMTQIEIDSVHWYYSENTGNADLAMATTTAQHLANGKPVYFTESGNRAHNWDGDSHTRMRIRSWTALFVSATLMWWNTAGTRSCSPCGGGNMYLGPTERGYQKVLRTFADHMLDPAVQNVNVTATPNTTSGAAVRAYGLCGAGAGDSTVQGSSAGADRVYMAYVHHTDHNSATQANVNFVTGSQACAAPGPGCSGFWVNPETGTTTAVSATAATTGNFTTPPFSIDVALVLFCKK